MEKSVRFRGGEIMRRYVRKNIRNLGGYIPGEQPGEKRYIKLNTNENPYPPSPRVADAIQRELNDGLRLYPDPASGPFLQKASTVYGFPSASLAAGNGSDELLSILTRTFLGEGEKVVYPYPTYTLYETLVRIQGGEVKGVPFPDDYSLPRGIEREKGKLLFIANPNSPSGTLTPLEKLSHVADRFRGVVVVDEAYGDFSGETALPLVKEKKNVVVLRTFSKSFSLAGIRLGLAFAPPWIIEEMNKVKDSYNVNRLSAAAGKAALSHMSWMRKNVKKIVQTRENLSRHLLTLGFEVFPSRANFLLIRKRGSSMKSIYLALKKKRILVRYFDTRRLADCLRITVGTDEEMESLLFHLEKLVG